MQAQTDQKYLKSYDKNKGKLLLSQFIKLGNKRSSCQDEI